MIPLSPPAAAVIQVLHRIETLVRKCRALAPTDAALADKAAAALAAGGKLYVAGDPGFVAEASGRAGGLMMVNGIAAPAIPPPGSVVLYGWTDDAGLERDRSWLESFHGVTIEGIGDLGPSQPQPFTGVIGLEDEEDLPGGEGSLAPLVNTVNLWEFTGELIAALSRRGRTPTVWQSIWVPGAKAHNDPRQGHDYDPTLHLAPIQPKVLARAYADNLLHALHSLESSAPDFAAAAGDLLAARRSGHSAHIAIIAHMVGEEIGGTEDPGLIQPLKDAENGSDLAAGDALLGLVYVGIPQTMEQNAQRAGVKATWFAAPSAETTALPAGQRWIDARWRLGDTAVSLPGYDVGALPPSGVLQLAAYWSVNAAMRAASESAPAGERP